jgi:phage protein D
MPVAERVDRRPVAQVYVSVDGSPVPGGFLEDMVRFMVETSIRLPDMATIELHNPELRWTEGSFRFAIGKPIVIEMGDADHKRCVFDGEITAIEIDGDLDGLSRVIVTAYDRAHRLQRGRKTRTFLNVTDSEIASKIAREYGLQPDVETTSISHEWVLQHNQTDMEFLSERAARNGFTLIVVGQKLLFKPPSGATNEPITITWRHELLAFRARVSAGEQVDRVEVRGWDPLRKQAVSAEANRPNQTWSNGITSTGGSTAQQSFGNAAMAVLREPVYSQDQAKALAQAVLDDLGGMFIQSEGTALGNPLLRLGSKVRVEGVGSQFSGEYVTTDVRHVYEQSGYQIEFKAAGTRSNDVMTLMNAGAPRSAHVMTGIVSNHKDPDDLGRVKVKLPVLGDSIESHWCRIAAPGAGAERGVEYLPEVDDEVLVAGAHMDDLYVLGGLWNMKDAAPEGNSAVVKGGKVCRRIIKSRTGHVIAIDDSDDGGSISIIDAAGKNRVIIDTSSKSIELVAEKDIKIEAGQNLNIESKMGATSMKAGTDFKLQSTTSATVETQGQLGLTSTGPAKLQSSSMTEVKAPMVNVGQ